MKELYGLFVKMENGEPESESDSPGQRLPSRNLQQVTSKGQDYMGNTSYLQ